GALKESGYYLSEYTERARLAEAGRAQLFQAHQGSPLRPRRGAAQRRAAPSDQFVAYHAHVSQLQPCCKQDRFLPDFGQSRVCEYNLSHLDPIGRATSSSPSSLLQSPSTRRPPPVKRSVSTGSTAKRVTGSSCRTSML